MMPGVLIAGVLLALLCCLGVWYFRNAFRPRVSSASSAVIRRTWETVSSVQPPLRKVMDSAALFDRTLQELGYRGSLGDKLKAAGNYVTDRNEVWRVVKLRNALAHEVGKEVTDQQAAQAFAILRRASEAFLRP